MIRALSADRESPFPRRAEVPNLLARLIVVAAVMAVGGILAGSHPDPATAAESAYLSRLASWVLFALAVGSARSTLPVVVGGGALAVLLWMPAAEGTRGVAALAILVAVLAASSVLAVRGRRSLAAVEASALAIGWQAVLRSERFIDLAIDLQAAIWMVGLPVLFGIATAHLSRRDRWGAVIAAAALLPLTPGTGVVPTAVIACLAVTAGRPASPAAMAVVTIAALAAVGWRAPEAVAPLVVAVIAAMSSWVGVRWWPVGAAAAWCLMARWTLDGLTMATTAGWLALSLPAIWLVPSAARRMALAALLLALAAPSVAALAPAVGVAALAIGAGGRRAVGQRSWSLAVLAVAALAAAYPWWRGPLLGLFDGQRTWGWVLLALLLALAMRPRSSPVWAAPLAAVVGLTMLPAPGRELLVEPEVLAGDRSGWQRQLGGETVEEVVIDAFLTAPANGPGWTTATVRLATAEGVEAWPIRSGIDLAPWDARMPTPAPWLSWVTADGSVAHRYRLRRRIEPPLAATAIEIEKDPGLRNEAGIVVLGVATR